MYICSTYCLQFRLEKSGIFFCLESGDHEYRTQRVGSTCVTGHRSGWLPNASPHLEHRRTDARREIAVLETRTASEGRVRRACRGTSKRWTRDTGATCGPTLTVTVLPATVSTVSWAQTNPASGRGDPFGILSHGPAPTLLRHWPGLKSKDV